MQERLLKGNIITEEQVFFGTLSVADKRIAHIEKQGEARPDASWITPGFIDVHTHASARMARMSRRGRWAWRRLRHRLD